MWFKIILALKFFIFNLFILTNILIIFNFLNLIIKKKKNIIIIKKK
jgi:hypothetical protein